MSDVLPQLGSTVCTTIRPVQYAASSGSMSRLDPSGNRSTLGVSSSFYYLYYATEERSPSRSVCVKLLLRLRKKDFSPGHSKQCVLK